MPQLVVTAVLAATPDSPRLAELRRRTGAATGSAEDVANWADVVVLGVRFPRWTS